MKPPARKVLILGSVFATAAIVLFFSDAQKVGRELDSHRGIPVYYNGLLFFRSYGKYGFFDSLYCGYCACIIIPCATAGVGDMIGAVPSSQKFPELPGEINSIGRRATLILNDADPFCWGIR